MHSKVYEKGNYQTDINLLKGNIMEQHPIVPLQTVMKSDTLAQMAGNVGWTVKNRTSTETEEILTLSRQIGAPIGPSGMSIEGQLATPTSKAPIGFEPVGAGEKTYTPKDRGLFVKTSDIYKALNRGWSVTVGADGIVREIWDPKTGYTYDKWGNVTGHHEEAPVIPPTPKVLPPAVPVKPGTWQDAEASIKKILKTMVDAMLTQRVDYLRAAVELINREEGKPATIKDSDLNKTIDEMLGDWINIMDQLK